MYKRVSSFHQVTNVAETGACGSNVNKLAEITVLVDLLFQPRTALHAVCCINMKLLDFRISTVQTRLVGRRAGLSACHSDRRVGGPRVVTVCIAVFWTQLTNLLIDPLFRATDARVDSTVASASTVMNDKRNLKRERRKNCAIFQEECCTYHP